MLVGFIVGIKSKCIFIPDENFAIGGTRDNRVLKEMNILNRECFFLYGVRVIFKVSKIKNFKITG
jgi:hypothetical protein